MQLERSLPASALCRGQTCDYDLSHVHRADEDLLSQSNRGRFTLGNSTCALSSTQHCAQPRTKAVSSSMSMLKGKGLLYLLGMNVFGRGTSPAGQGSFATEYPPHRQDSIKEKGQVLQGVSLWANTDKAETQQSRFEQQQSSSRKPGRSSYFRPLTAQVIISRKERLDFLFEQTP